MGYQPYGQRNRRDKESRSPVLIGLVAVALIVVAAVALVMTISRASQPGRETLVVGTSSGFPPFEMRFGEQVRGLDIDLCAKVAEALDREMVVRDLAFDALLPSLGRGVVDEKPPLDIVCAAVTKTPNRDEVVDFSDNYFSANQAILATKDSGIVYSSPEDLNDLFVAYQEGTTSQDWFEDNVLGNVEVSGHESFNEMVIALQRIGKDFDVLIMDEPAARAFLKKRDHLTIVGTIETGEEYGFAVADGDPQGILSAANSVLDDMRTSGEYDTLIERWFGNEK